ncbi:YlcI/YnfO family protein [Escherichia coli]|uniref:YlcI/YnfO family protein n=1 Tax=Escherichia coli TaxID=562 RepID=UPI002075CFE9|nr:YlcI/YnfO family protein [Escherichia coli]
MRFPNHMIEQINIALEHKGSSNFSAWVIEACRRRLATDATHLRTASMTNNEK